MDPIYGIHHFHVSWRPIGASHLFSLMASVCPQIRNLPKYFDQTYITKHVSATIFLTLIFENLRQFGTCLFCRAASHYTQAGTTTVIDTT